MLVAVPLSVLLTYAFLGSVRVGLLDAGMIALLLMALWVQWG